jgi:hypothetical protein
MLLGLVSTTDAVLFASSNEVDDVDGVDFDDEEGFVGLGCIFLSDFFNSIETGEASESNDETVLRTSPSSSLSSTSSSSLPTEELQDC